MDIDWTTVETGMMTALGITASTEVYDMEERYTPYSERIETYIVPIIFALIFIVGIMGNGTLVLIFYRHRAMRNVPNTYILSLALADLLVIVTCVPYTAQIYTVPTWTWGLPLCKLSETTKDISIGVSVFTLTALSAERYRAIVKPLRRYQMQPLTMMSAISIWLLAIVLALPSLFLSHLEVVDLPNYTGTNSTSSILVCSPFPAPPYKQTYAQISVIIKALIYYLIPLSVISFYYVLMAKRLEESTREMPGEMHSQSAPRTRRHIAKMVLAIVFVFFICFLPHHVFMLWFWLHPSAEDEYNDFWHVLRITGFCLSFLNSCVNPVALYCVSSLFRQHFNYYLFCRRPQISQQRPAQPALYAETSFISAGRQTRALALETHDTLRNSCANDQPMMTIESTAITIEVEITANNDNDNLTEIIEHQAVKILDEKGNEDLIVVMTEELEVAGCDPCDNV